MKPKRRSKTTIKEGAVVTARFTVASVGHKQPGDPWVTLDAVRNPLHAEDLPRISLRLSSLKKAVTG